MAIEGQRGIQLGDVQVPQGSNGARKRGIGTRKLHGRSGSGEGSFMTAISAMTFHWAIILGSITLLCWMFAGFSAVLGTKGEIRNAEPGRLSDYVTTGLAAVGFVSLAAMGLLLGFGS
jgi:hypothetical protein